MNLFESLSKTPGFSLVYGNTSDDYAVFDGGGINVSMVDNEFGMVTVYMDTPDLVKRFEDLGKTLGEFGVRLTKENTDVDLYIDAYHEGDNEPCDECGDFPKNDYNIYVFGNHLELIHHFGCYGGKTLIDTDLTDPLPTVSLSKEDKSYEEKIQKALETVRTIGLYIETNKTEEA